MPTKERRKGKTPSGGSLSEIYYFNDSLESVDKSKATKAIIRELDEQGNLINETFGSLS